MKIKNLLYKRVDDLTSIQKDFYIKHQESGRNPLLNAVSYTHLTLPTTPYV